MWKSYEFFISFSLRNLEFNCEIFGLQARNLVFKLGISNLNVKIH